MREDDTQSFRRLIQYAKQESDEINRPFISYLLGMVLCELDNIDINITTNGVIAPSKPANGNGRSIFDINSD